MLNLTNLVGPEGVNINVGVNRSDIVYISLGVFAGIFVAGFLLLLIKKSFDNNK